MTSLQTAFSADIFLQDLWNTVPLEVLRDDLGAYLKVLVFIIFVFGLLKNV